MGEASGPDVGTLDRTPLESTVAPQLASTVNARPRYVDDDGEVDDFERGAVIGRYVVIDRLGAGGMGVVYAAYDPELDRKIALKFLKPGTGDSESNTRLLREAQAMARLAHPNIVTVHDVGAFAERVFISMEFVQGMTLRRWLDDRPRSWREVLAVFLAVGRGLVAAHATGLIHRDLKPDNIMIGDDARVRVMDFGLARASAEVVCPAADEPTLRPHQRALEQALTRTGAFVGTPPYMAPEQWNGTVTDARTDQFAFCVALWEALHGERPFRGATIAALFTAVLDGTIAPPRDARRAPAWLRRTLARGLAVDPAARWPTMAALLAELARDRLARVRRWMLLGGGLALLVAAATGVREIVEQRASEARAVARASRADDDARAAARAAEVARDEATEQLRQSLLVQAAAAQRTIETGRRFASLDAIARSAAISTARGMTAEERTVLRDQAIVGLSLADARQVRRWSHGLYHANHLTLDPQLARYAGSDRRGNVSVRRTSDDTTLAEITSPRPDVWYVHLDLGPRRLSVAFATRAPFAAANQVFELGDLGPAPLWSVEEPLNHDAGLDTAVVRRRSGHLDVLDAATGRVLRRLRTRSKLGQAGGPVLDPSGRYLAIFDGAARRVEVLDIVDDVRVATLEAFGGTPPRWSTTGLLALPRARDIAVWDVHTGETHATLRGHTMTVISLAFHPDNRHLVSGSWDTTTRLWDWSLGAEVLQVYGTLARVHEDGAQLATVAGEDLMLWDLEMGAELRSFAGSAVFVDFSADGRLLAIAGAGGVQIWHIAEHRRLWRSVRRHCFAAAFDLVAPGLYTDCSEGGLERRGFAIEDSGELAVGPARALRGPIEAGYEYQVFARPAAASPWLATNLDTHEIQLLDATTLAAGPRLRSPRSVRELVFSPDGRWLTSGGYRSDGLFLWDLHDPGEVHALPAGRDGFTFHAFTPDSRALLTDVDGKYTLWDLETRRPRAAVANEHGLSSLPVAVSPDGRTFVVMHDAAALRLLDATNFGVLAALPVTKFHVTQLRFSPDGRWLAVLDDTGGVRLWDLARLRGGLARLELDW